MPVSKLPLLPAATASEAVLARTTAAADSTDQMTEQHAVPTVGNGPNTAAVQNIVDVQFDATPTVERPQAAIARAQLAARLRQIG